ncbi:hypothetical protein V6N13_066680 [Hibiscus sabdariffa]
MYQCSALCCWSLSLFVVGSLLIVGGLYAVLWGKDKEMKETKGNEKGEEEKGEVGNDLELQSQPPLKGNQLGGGTVVN